MVAIQKHFLPEHSSLFATKKERNKFLPQFKIFNEKCVSYDVYATNFFSSKNFENFQWSDSFKTAEQKKNVLNIFRNFLTNGLKNAWQAFFILSV